MKFYIYKINFFRNFYTLCNEVRDFDEISKRIKIKVEF